MTMGTSERPAISVSLPQEAALPPLSLRNSRAMNNHSSSSTTGKKNTTGATRNVSKYTEKVGKAIRSLRLGKNMRQEDLAVLLKVSQSCMSRIEHKGPETIAMAERVAKALDVRIHDLLALAEGVAGGTAVADMVALSPEEHQLLSSYRALPEEGQKMIKAVVSTLSTQKKRYRGS